jgi:hypothetical protein
VFQLSLSRLSVEGLEGFGKTQDEDGEGEGELWTSQPMRTKTAGGLDSEHPVSHSLYAFCKPSILRLMRCIPIDI